MARPKRNPAGPEDAGARERLLQAGLALFNARGYAATTVREIVEHAGVSKPVLYYYFQSKEGLYLELVSGPFSRHQELLAGAGSGDSSPTGRLFALCDTLFRHFVENLEVARLLFSIYYGPPQGAPPIDIEGQGRKVIPVIEGLIREAIVAGEIRSSKPEEICWGINALLNAAFQEQLTPQPQMDGTGLKRVMSLFLSGVGGTV